VKLTTTTVPRPDDVDRLPQRHQRYIKNLEGRLQEFETAQESQQPTRLIYDPYGTKRYLPDGDSVRLLVGPDTLAENARCIDVQLKDAYGYDKNGTRDIVEVHGDDSLIVLANASNSLYVTTRFMAPRIGRRL
jgi:hypothetical protein